MFQYPKMDQNGASVIVSRPTPLTPPPNLQTDERRVREKSSNAWRHRRCDLTGVWGGDPLNYVPLSEKNG